MMDNLPDEVASMILERINKIADKSSISLTCKSFHKLDKVHRKSIRVGCGLHPANEGLLSLCLRFQNLEKIEISYRGWKPELGQQLDDIGLYNLSVSCRLLKDLTLISCIDITDAGLSHLASCSRLSTLKLFFTRRITGSAMLPLAAGCEKLVLLHLVSCRNFRFVEYLGKVKTLEDVCIKNCKAIGELDLIKLMPSWETLKSIHFEKDTSYQFTKVEKWPSWCVFPWDNLLELILVNSPGGALSGIFSKCRNLVKIQLDMCFGVEDSDIIALAQNSTNLRRLSLRVPSDLCLSLSIRNHDQVRRLTDRSLNALAKNCPRLESIRIAFSIGDFPTVNSFSIQGILGLVRNCPVRELVLDRVYSLDDAAMEALSGLKNLEKLDLIECVEVTDVGLRVAPAMPRLRDLKLTGCVGVSDYGFKPFIRRRKLKVLSVEGCPKVSELGIVGAADSVSFKDKNHSLSHSN